MSQKKLRSVLAFTSAPAWSIPKLVLMWERKLIRRVSFSSHCRRVPQLTYYIPEVVVGNRTKQHLARMCSIYGKCLIANYLLLQFIFWSIWEIFATLLPHFCKTGKAKGNTEAGKNNRYLWSGYFNAPE